MISKYSGKHYLCCYSCERQQSLFDGHMPGFSIFGGVFPALIYDNLTTAVQRVFQGKKRILRQGHEKSIALYRM
jgi:hypothetical protein